MLENTSDLDKYVTTHELNAALEKQTKLIITAITEELSAQLGVFRQMVHDEFIALKKDIAELKRDVKQLKRDVEQLKATTSRIGTRQVRAEDRTDGHAERIRALEHVAFKPAN